MVAGGKLQEDHFMVKLKYFNTVDTEVSSKLKDATNAERFASLFNKLYGKTKSTGPTKEPSDDETEDDLSISDLEPPKKKTKVRCRKTLATRPVALTPIGRSTSDKKTEDLNSKEFFRVDEFY